MADPAKKPQRKPRGAGRRFTAGQSGNPAGRPVGSRNRATTAIEALLEGEAEAIGRKCVEMAKEGDGLAMKLVMERLVPLRRGRPVQFSLAPMEGPGDLVKSLGRLLQSVAAGEITPDEGAVISGILNAKRLAIETVEIETRLGALERAAAGKS